MSSTAPPRAYSGSCAEALARVERHLAPELAGAAARWRLHDAAGALPAGLASSLWLECRLAPGAEQVDLSLKLHPTGLGRIARDGPPGSPPGGADPLADRVRTLARRWLGPESALGRGATGVWLEYDLPLGAARDAALPAPGVFVQLACVPPGAGGVAGWSAVVAEALGALLGAAPGGGLLRDLSRCFLALPPGVQAVQLGVMLSRGDGSVRLCMVFPEPGALPRYLARVGGTGVPELAAALALLAGREPGTPRARWMLHLDVGDGGVLPRLGVDLRLDPRPQLRGRLRESAVLDRLARAGLADAGKAAGLLAWPGAHRAAGLPAAPARALVRRVSHLKLVCRPGHAPEAKAYLAFGAISLPGANPGEASPGPRAG